MSGRITNFFYENPIFTLEEIREKLPYEGDQRALWSLIRYHTQKDHLLKIKNGLYASIKPGFDRKNFIVDAYLVAGKLTEDAVIGYQSALDYWGYLHSIRNDLVYLTERRLSKSHFIFQNLCYKSVSFPTALVSKGQTSFEVNLINRFGVDIRITSIERTFVDILHRPNLLNYDWEEIYKSLSSIPYLNLSRVMEYVLMLNSNSTVAKVGLFLDFFKKKWFVEDKHFRKLCKFVPKQSLYVDKKSKEKQRLVSKWNILVPESLLNQNWEEPYGNI